MNIATSGVWRSNIATSGVLIIFIDYIIVSSHLACCIIPHVLSHDEVIMRGCPWEWPQWTSNQNNKQQTNTNREGRKEGRKEGGRSKRDKQVTEYTAFIGLEILHYKRD